MDIKTFIVSITGGVIISLIGFFLGRLGHRQDRKTDRELENEKEREKEYQELREVVRTQSQELAVLKAEAMPINAAYQAMLIAKLTHNHTPVADALMGKLGKPGHPKTLNSGELSELSDVLGKTANDQNVSESERIAADILPKIARMAEIEEEEAGTAEYENVLVSVPKTTTIMGPDGQKRQEEVVKNKSNKR